MRNQDTPPLAPLEVEEVKSWLRENPQSIGRICTRLAVEKVETLRGIDLKKSFAYNLINEVGEVAIENYVTIQKAFAMPNSVEWPADATISPGEVRQEIESIQARENHG